MPPFPGHGRPWDEELARLWKKTTALREANDILKKAAVSFARTVDLTPSGRYKNKRGIQYERRRRWENKTKNGGCIPRSSKPRRQALAQKREKPVSQAAKDLGINGNQLYRWIQQAREAAETGLPPFPGHGRPRDEELSRQRKEVKAV
ncbi:MAG: hypothetical protein LBG24_11600 [Treponema sp.]|nr:hypothetical protein [Treponema sp.]